MGKCDQHPQCALPGDGVCPNCLQKKLNFVWRGESYADAHDPILPKEAIAIIGSIASITKRNHPKQFTDSSVDVAFDRGYADGVAAAHRKPHPSFDGGSRGGAVGSSARKQSQNQSIEGVMKDWTELHAKRRSQAAVATLVNKNPTLRSTAGERRASGTESRPGMNDLAGARSVGSRSLPLVDRVAKEIALRVIREVGDENLSVDELEEERSSCKWHQEDDNGSDAKLQSMKLHQEKLSPSHWRRRFRSKWVKGLGSPLTSSSKVFPSKSVETVQKSQAQSSPARNDFRVRGSQRNFMAYNVEHSSELTLAAPRPKIVYDSQFSSETVIEGMPDQILKPEDMNQRLKTSYETVLAWLQDLPCPQTPLFQKTGHPEEPLSLVTEIEHQDLYPEDLTLVGHLHEIAEEYENDEESSEEEEISMANHLSEVSSFGKFLIRAAQRQPKEGLSRVASATST